jgi:SAM-dependent methyltransferase
VTVVRDFERLYREESDPWSIGAADSSRYERYLELISPNVRGAVLDIGCGFGALLARLKGQAGSLDGVEISATAIEKGKKRFPFITFHRGSAADLGAAQGLRDRKFDLIICSDVIYYLPDREKALLLAWINRHLTCDGAAFIAAWCPGGKYLTASELVEMTRRHMVPMRSETLTDSGHLALLCRRRRRFTAITIDYETWHPIPERKRIDWEADVFEPTERLFELFGKTDVAATFFAEMGEYFWLLANEPKVAHRMEEQWRQAVRRGHDVQLHLHPCWLPETGATCIDGNWYWDWSKAKADDYPGDLAELIGRCKTALERVIQPVCRGYTVTSFRAGAYQAQPFERLALALAANGIMCDSSVFPDGKSSDRGFDYCNPYTRHQPYFADRFDPQLKALPKEEEIIELPIFTPEPGRRWFIDNDEGERLAERLARYERHRTPPISVFRRRALMRMRRYSTALYCLAEKQRRVVNCLLPRRAAHALVAQQNLRQMGNLYYVAIGHTKADLRIDALERNLRELRDSLDVEFVTISNMALAARKELEKGRCSDARDAIDDQGKPETRAIAGREHDSAKSFHLQDMIPLDVARILDFGCGAGYRSARIAELYPWVEVTGVDAREALVAKAQRLHARPRVKFEVGDLARLAHTDGAFDCAYADSVLEHTFDLDATLREIHRVLRPGGSLVAALPVDGLNPDQDCDHHTWKTVRAQVVLRLARAGFSNIRADEVDAYRELGMPPYMPSNDRFLYVRAWKVEGDDDAVKRALRAMDWLYHRIEPTNSNLSEDPKQIIADGYGYCIAYTIALGHLLKREGYDVTWITMRAEGHERGRGPLHEDTHELVELGFGERRILLDPMANTYFPHSLKDLLQDPTLADKTANRDDRCLSRGYSLYNTSYWFERVKDFNERRNPHTLFRLWKTNGIGPRRFRISSLSLA